MGRVWMRMLLVGGAWLGLLIPTAGVAQEKASTKVAVGDAVVHGETLKPFTNKWGMKLIKSDGSIVQDGGFWTDELEAVEINGRPCWRRTQRATFKKSNGEVAATNKTVNVFDRKTLEPVTREFELHSVGGEDTSVKISFSSSLMKVENTQKGKTEVKELATTPAFDFYGGVYAVLWVALPLRPGFTATFPSYTEDENPEKVTLVTYEITGREKVEAGRLGKVEAWVVESDTMIGFLKYWISEEAPYIIRMDYKAKDGTTWLLTMT